jgi:hypothetical protein
MWDECLAIIENFTFGVMLFLLHRMLEEEVIEVAIVDKG